MAVLALFLSSLFVATINVLLTAKDVVLLRIETPDRVIKERVRTQAKYNSGAVAPAVENPFT